MSAISATPGSVSSGRRHTESAELGLLERVGLRPACADVVGDGGGGGSLPPLSASASSRVSSSRWRPLTLAMPSTTAWYCHFVRPAGSPPSVSYVATQLESSVLCGVNRSLSAQRPGSGR